MTSRKIVIVGGTGLIGAKLARQLALAGQDVVVAAPSTGVNSVTGLGVAEAMEGADVVVDVSNAMSFDPAEVRSFFETSTRKLTSAAKAAGVGHYIALSIVGTDRMPGNGYFDGKMAQEAAIVEAGVPYTIVRATQFFEFLGPIADAYSRDGTVFLSGGQFQPIAADDVALILASVAQDDPAGGIVEIAGPERTAFNSFVDRFLVARGDGRAVKRDDSVDYFGGKVEALSLVPVGEHRTGTTTLNSWLSALVAA